jgi:hypothetical protein
MAYSPVAKPWLCKQLPLPCNARSIHVHGDVTQKEMVLQAVFMGPLRSYVYVTRLPSPVLVGWVKWREVNGGRSVEEHIELS